MRQEERKRVWIDLFQTHLAVRIGAYLGAFLVVVTNFLFAWKLLKEGVANPLEQLLALFRDYLPFWICLLTLLPFMAWDAIRFSHRLTGPLVRFRRTMQRIAEGEPVSPIKLRKDDYLSDLRSDFNDMLNALQRRGVPILKPDVSEEEPTQRKPA
jgi:nitrogen fixation/metabolism regulation signal transduction histidine kinase